MPEHKPTTWAPEHEPATWAHHCTAGGSVVVELSGEIDALVAPRLSEYLDTLTATDGPDLVLDMRKVEFIDCSGISCLVRVHKRARKRSGRVRFVITDARTLRTLRITRLLGHLEILDSLPGSDPAAP
mgnify:CR=1 FL=1